MLQILIIEKWSVACLLFPFLSNHCHRYSYWTKNIGQDDLNNQRLFFSFLLLSDLFVLCVKKKKKSISGILHIVRQGSWLSHTGERWWPPVSVSLQLSSAFHLLDIWELWIYLTKNMTVVIYLECLINKDKTSPKLSADFSWQQ